MRLRLLGLTVERLTAAGYVYIGMDHFALPNDELVRAKRQRSLQRNFQGYSTHADQDLIGLGVSSIGKVGDSYSQNFKSLPDYYAAIDAGHLPVQRGILLTQDDQIRRAVIQELMCHELIDCAAIGRAVQHRLQTLFQSRDRATAGIAGARSHLREERLHRPDPGGAPARCARSRWCSTPITYSEPAGDVLQGRLSDIDKSPER